MKKRKKQTPKTVAYLRVSTDLQDLDTQKLAILDYAQQSGITIDDFIQSQTSSRKSPKERKLDFLLEQLEPGDLLLVSELSRLGRSVGQIIQFVDELNSKNVRLIALKENIHLLGKENDLQSKVMITLFGLFAEIERELISQRTKEGIAKARAKGKLLGRPKGPGKSRLDGKEAEIQTLLDKKVPKSSIAKILGVSRSALISFIKSRLEA